jgi:hypothetical protein
MVKINDLIVLKNILRETKIGKMSNEGLRGYLKLSLTMNKYYNEFEEKRKNLVTEAIENKGYDIQNITAEQDRDIFNVIAPILDEYLGTEVDVDTKVLSWDDLCSGVLNLDENTKLTVDDKTKITEYLCKEDL